MKRWRHRSLLARCSGLIATSVHALSFQGAKRRRFAHTSETHLHTRARHRPSQYLGDNGTTLQPDHVGCTFPLQHKHHHQRHPCPSSHSSHWFGRNRTRGLRVLSPIPICCDKALLPLIDPALSPFRRGSFPRLTRSRCSNLMWFTTLWAARRGLHAVSSDPHTSLPYLIDLQRYP